MKGKMKPCGTKPRHREHKKTKTNKHLQKKKQQKKTQQIEENERKNEKKAKNGSEMQN